MWLLCKCASWVYLSLFCGRSLSNSLPLRPGDSLYCCLRHYLLVHPQWTIIFCHAPVNQGIGKDNEEVIKKCYPLVVTRIQLKKNGGGTMKLLRFFAESLCYFVV